MNTILAMINEPDRSRGFIENSVDLARELSSNLHLLYVENPNNYPLGTPNLSTEATAQLQRNLEQSVENARVILTRQVEELMNKVSGELIIDVTTEISTEKAVIEKMIGENHAQMLVLESQGKHTFWARNVLTKEIIRSVDCPIWIIPEDSTYRPPEQIIYATDYNEHDIRTLIRLIKMLEGLSPTITALHITDSVDFELKIKEAGFQKMLQTNTDYKKINVNALVENGEEPSKLINDYAARVDADLIVVLKENHHFLERIFKASSTNKIIKYAEIPVLVFHEKEQSE